MPKSRLKPALFFDFDNTLTEGDVLDEVIEEYSASEAWRDWEHAWREGRLPAKDCLRLQVENLRVSRAELMDHLLKIRIDPAFSVIVAWARRRNVEVTIVSDSFQPLILHILLNNGIDGVKVFANALRFVGGNRLVPSFPFHDPASTCSANAKARHLAACRGNRIVFTGDGHSDLDAALAADVVFAKSTLARELDARGVSFYPFETLEPVLAFLETVEGVIDPLPLDTRSGR
jgi:2-hydroxy-3-keto-5-methylthiopentenyl-1-phosphate phosphatase